LRLTNRRSRTIRSRRSSGHWTNFLRRKKGPNVIADAQKKLADSQERKRIIDQQLADLPAPPGPSCRSTPQIPSGIGYATVIYRAISDHVPITVQLSAGAPNQGTP